MHHSVIKCSVVLLLTVLGVRSQAPASQRVSQTKCKEYRDWTTSNRIDCNRPKSLLPENTQPRDFPHHALFGYEQDDEPSDSIRFYSSGSLISDRWVLTAAHSTQHQRKQPVVVRLGAADLQSEDDDHHIDYEIAEIIRHPEYTSRLAYHDIALVRLKEPVQFSEYIRPICLWDSSEMNVTSVMLTGFGLADQNLRSQKLYNSNLEIQNKSFCEQIFQRSRRIPDGINDNQLCLVGTDSGRDNCHHSGDSGSPAQITLAHDHCARYVVGIGSFGSVCGVEHAAEIYTKVSSSIDWIESVVWN